MQKLAVKLIEAMKLCKYVMRNGINTFHKYKYATSADVLEKVNAAFTKQGIATIVVPEIIKDEYTDQLVIDLDASRSDGEWCA